MKKFRDFLFLCAGGDMRLDSWTYGDWRQYLCDRPDGSIQCARVAGWVYMVMLVFWILSFATFATGALLALGIPSERLNVSAIYVAGGVAGAISAFWLFLWLRGLNIMTAVSPRQYDGVRIFNHEA